MFWGDDLDAMREGGASQIGIDEGDDSADFADAKPDGHIFGPVRHQQTHGLAFGESLCKGPAGILIRPLGESTIGQAFAVGDQSRRFIELLASSSITVGKMRSG